MVGTWTVTIHLFDGDDVRRTTTAHAILTTTAGTSLLGSGHATRRPGDVDVPEVGEELAVSRALRALADQLLDATSADISAIEHHPVRVPV